MATTRSSFQSIVKAVYKLLGDHLRIGDGYGRCNRSDVWHEFTAKEKPHHCVTLQREEDGWHLRDGDPICNWCFNTFDKRYDFSTSPEVIAHRIRRELTVNQPRLEKEDSDYHAQRGAKFAQVVEGVLCYLPKSIKAFEFAKIKKEHWTHCAFTVNGRGIQVRLTMENEFDDFWLRGGRKDRQGCDTVRKRWTGRVRSIIIAKAIATALQ